MTIDDGMRCPWCNGIKRLESAICETCSDEVQEIAARIGSVRTSAVPDPKPFCKWCSSPKGPYQVTCDSCHAWRTNLFEEARNRAK